MRDLSGFEACLVQARALINAFEGEARMNFYVDADACPVKDEAVRVAERHRLEIHFVANTGIAPAVKGHSIKRVVVPDGPDAADDWIVERAWPRATSSSPPTSRWLLAASRRGRG